MRQSQKWYFWGCSVLLTLLTLAFIAVYSLSRIEIKADEVGVVFNTISGDLAEETLAPGTHYITPFVEEVTIYSTAAQEYTIFGDDGITALTLDGQQVSLDATLIYRIDAAQVKTVHIRWRDRYVNSLIRPALRSTARDGINQFTGQGLYCGNRTALNETVETGVQRLIETEGFVVDAVLIRNLQFTPEFIAGHDCGS